ncbi:MAG: beta-propeller fold lactonase family protein [Erysipelotrichaceae bacterium]|jgi:6-phosphogluconolactonase|nr:beta-propeller fold lactonase family protein [Erysipelotrichaceae bacterium]
MITGFVGTYLSPRSKGLYRFQFDEQNLHFLEKQLFFEAEDVKYVSYMDGMLAFPCRRDQAQLICIQDQLVHAKESFEQDVAVYVVQDQQYIYTVNYHDGVLIRYEKADLKIDKKVFIQEEAGCHQVLLTKDRIIVPCRLLDALYIYDRRDLTLVQILNFPVGSGPRHGAVTADENTIYVISENTSELFLIHNEPTMKIVKQLTLSVKGRQWGGAAIRLSRDERFLYLSLRGSNQVAVVDTSKWQVIQRMDSHGDHPRDAALSPDEQYVFVINRTCGTMAVFSRNAENGRLQDLNREITIEQGVSIVFAEKEAFK